MFAAARHRAVSGRRGSRTHIPVRGRALAVRPGEPYPAAFRNRSGPTGNRTRPVVRGRGRHARAASSRWTISPVILLQWTSWEVEPIAVRVQAQLAPSGMQAQLSRGPPGNRTRSSSLPQTRAAANTYRPRCRSDPGWNRTSTLLHVTQASSPLDHGIGVTRVGVEPTGTRLRAPTAGWSLAPLPVCVPGRRQVADPGVAPGGSGL